MYNKNNFHKYTFCEFIEIEPNKISKIKTSYKSKSGSYYHFTNEGVYRISNHWGRAANCRWRLISNSSLKINNSQNRIGYAKWTDFYPNNETENFFYVEVNFETNEVVFKHKDNPNYTSKATLRNASETAKVIRQIKDVLTSDQWAKYLNLKDIDSARKFVINQIVTTELSLNEIKKRIPNES